MDRMTQFGMIIDLERCMGCHTCAIACKAEWEVPADKGRNWVKRLGPANTTYGLSFTCYPGSCNHCDQPACVEVCPADPVERIFTDGQGGKSRTMEVTATWKDPFNGTVQIDRERCLGCGACVDACPYQARYLNEEGGQPRADKCTFCVERLVRGLEPACVLTCPARARIFGDLDDPGSEVSSYVNRGAIRLESAGVKLGPNVRYYGRERDLHLLKSTSAPREMPEANLRRTLMGRMFRPAAKELANLGLLGIAGALCSGKPGGSEEKK
jgi:tetrathionate reductase subunit B